MLHISQNKIYNFLDFLFLVAGFIHLWTIATMLLLFPLHFVIDFRNPWIILALAFTYWGALIFFSLAIYNKFKNSQRAQLVISILIFSLTLIITYFIIGFITENVLVPWDSYPLEMRPTLGTWLRTTNDFFEATLGSHLPSIGIMIISLFIVVIRGIKDKTVSLKQILTESTWSHAIFIGSYIVVSVVCRLLVPSPVDTDGVTPAAHIDIFLIILFLAAATRLFYTLRYGLNLYSFFVKT